MLQASEPQESPLRARDARACRCRVTGRDGLVFLVVGGVLALLPLAAPALFETPAEGHAGGRMLWVWVMAVANSATGAAICGCAVALRVMRAPQRTAVGPGHMARPHAVLSGVGQQPQPA